MRAWPRKTFNAEAWRALHNARGKMKRVGGVSADRVLDQLCSLQGGGPSLMEGAWGPIKQRGGTRELREFRNRCSWNARPLRGRQGEGGEGECEKIGGESPPPTNCLSLRARKRAKGIGGGRKKERADP